MQAITLKHMHTVDKMLWDVATYKIDQMEPLGTLLGSAEILLGQHILWKAISSSECMRVYVCMQGWVCVCAGDTGIHIKLTVPI